MESGGNEAQKILSELLELNKRRYVTLNNSCAAVSQLLYHSAFDC